jgi:hypothetical protein
MTALLAVYAHPGEVPHYGGSGEVHDDASS